MKTLQYDQFENAPLIQQVASYQYFNGDAMYTP